MTNQLADIHGIFPTPIYLVKRDSNLIPEEEKEIERIIEEGMIKNISNSSSTNSYIFNDKLKNLKQFCEQQIKIYVEQVINPKEELDFYITQSWLNVTRPGESHHTHSHPNSIISGVFYVSTEEDDKIYFYDPAMQKSRIEFAINEFNLWNSKSWFVPTERNNLILFPSWLGHSVEPNEKATTDRISLSFNIFVRGTVGGQDTLSELILK